MAKQKWHEQSHFQTKIRNNTSANGDPVREAPPRPKGQTYVLKVDGSAAGPQISSEYRFTTNHDKPDEIRLVVWAGYYNSKLRVTRDEIITRKEAQEMWKELKGDGWKEIRRG